MKIFITKHALTRGIMVIDAENLGDGAVKPITTPGAYAIYYHGEGREWHQTWPLAAARAEAMRRDKIENLREQIAKLEALTF